MDLLLYLQAGALALGSERGSENYKTTHEELQPQEVSNWNIPIIS